jgi:hypothetical protein
LGKIGGGSFFNTFRYADPVTGDEVTTTKSNGFSGISSRTTLDPNGVDVPLADPFPPPGEEGDGSCVIWDENFEGDGKSAGTVIPIEGSAGCVLDGLPMDCRFISGESSVECPNNDCGTRIMTVTARSRGVQVGPPLPILVSPGQPGWNGSLDGTYAVDGDQLFRTSNRLGFNHARINPQNSEQRLTENEYLTLRTHITKALESKECRDFINSLVSYNQKGKPFDSQNQLAKLAEDVYKSPDGGIFWRPGHGGQDNSKLKFWIGKGGEPFKLNTETYANEITHLLIHHVTTGSDNTLSENIRDLGIVPTRKDGTPLDFPTGMKDGKPFNDFSNYWDTALRRACFPNLPF